MVSMANKVNRFHSIFVLASIFLITSTTHAQLSVESVSQNIGQVGGENLSITISGSGFDSGTRIMMVPDVGNRHQRIASLEMPFSTQHLTASGHYAYVAGTGNLQAVDLSQPMSPEMIGEPFPISDWVTSLTSKGNILCVGLLHQGLWLIDVSIPNNPSIITTITETGGAIRDSVFVGNFVYAVNDHELLAVNMDDPADIRRVKPDISTDSWNNLAIGGQYAYIADSNGLNVISIGNLSDPELTYIGAAPLSGSWVGNSVNVSENRAYITGAGTQPDNTDWGLQIFDISDPESPEVIGLIKTNQAATGVNVFGRRAYVIQEYENALTVDIDDSSTPIVVGIVKPSGFICGLEVINNVMVVASSISGLEIYDAEDPRPSLVQGVVSLQGAEGIDIEGQYAYVANWSGLHLVDVRYPRAPQLLKSVDIPGGAKAVEVMTWENYVWAFVAGGYGRCTLVDYTIIDGTPSYNSPYQEDFYVELPTGLARDLKIGQDVAYVITDSQVDGAALYSLDISRPIVTYKPNEEFILAEWSLPPNPITAPVNPMHLDINGGFACVADWYNGLWLIDIERSTSIPQLKSVPGTAEDVAVIGSRALVAGDQFVDNNENKRGGLYIVDLDNLTAEADVVDVPADVNTITISGNRAYLGTNYGFYIADIASLDAPVVIGRIDTLGDPQEIIQKDDLIYVVDRTIGLTILPDPVEIIEKVIDSEEQMTVTMPSPPLAGHYNIWVSNQDATDELIGAVTFLSPSDYSNLSEKKAILIAGRNPGNVELWEATQLCLRTAYKALLNRGYDKENIFFLSPEGVDLDGDGSNDEDNSSLDALTWPVEGWPSETGELLVYMVGHGTDRGFQFDGSQFLWAEELDGWLDDIAPDIATRTVLVYDACRSGSFLQELTPAGENRIVIASTKPNDTALFGSDGTLSFSYHFWSRLFNDSNLARAFNRAKSIVRAPQVAQLDANGNGIANELQDDIAGIEIGAVHSTDRVGPNIGRISEPISLSDTTEATFEASSVSSDAGGELSVWAEILPPGSWTGATSITDNTIIQLVDDNSGVYQGSYADFSISGTYQVLLQARDLSGVSLPKELLVYKDGADTYEPDDVSAQAKSIGLTPDSPQHHHFHQAGDEDWIKFYGIAGETYTIAATNLFPDCNIVLELFDSNGSSLLDEPKDTIGDPNADEIIDWQCQTSGIHYIRLTHKQPEQFGIGTDYDISIYRPIAPPNQGTLAGKILDEQTGDPIQGAIIRTSGNCTFISLNDGSYLVSDAPGTCTITVSADNYTTQTISVEIPEVGSTPLDIKMVKGTGSSSSTDTDGGGGGGGCFIGLIDQE